METLLEEVLKFDNKENRALPLEKRKNIANQIIKLVGNYVSTERDGPLNVKSSLQTHEVVYGLRVALELSEIDEDVKFRAGFLGGLYNQNKSRGEHIPYILINLDNKDKSYIPVREWR